MKLTEEKREALSFIERCDPSFLVLFIKHNTHFDAKVMELVFQLAKERARDLLSNGE